VSLAITGEGTQVFLGTPVGVEPIVYTLLGELGDLQSVGREWGVNDVTNFQSGMTKEKIKGLREPGQYNLTGNRIFGDASQAQLQTAFDDPRPYWFQVILPVNPASGGGEIWTFAALVLSIDPPKIAPNKAIQFFSKLQATGPRQTSNGYLNATGALTKFRSVTLGGFAMVVTWSDFSVPAIRPLPNDAVILGIYPVIIASGNYDICFQDMTYGPPSSTLPAGGPFTNPYNTNPITPGASFGSTEFWGPSIGAALALLANQQIAMAIDSSLLNGSITDSMDATGVGFAVYYASAAPRVDATMPPPFAVPAGQGLAWALPFAVTALAEDGQGNTGTAVGTAAVLNCI
jgi:hypothetical protein